MVGKDGDLYESKPEFSINPCMESHGGVETHMVQYAGGLNSDFREEI
jgi:hypothetical protein